MNIVLALIGNLLKFAGGGALLLLLVVYQQWGEAPVFGPSWTVNLVVCSGVVFLGAVLGEVKLRRLLWQRPFRRKEFTAFYNLFSDQTLKPIVAISVILMIVGSYYYHGVPLSLGAFILLLVFVWVMVDSALRSEPRQQRWLVRIVGKSSYRWFFHYCFYIDLIKLWFGVGTVLSIVLLPLLGYSFSDMLGHTIIMFCYALLVLESVYRTEKHWLRWPPYPD